VIRNAINPKNVSRKEKLMELKDGVFGSTWKEESMESRLLGGPVVWVWELGLPCWRSEVRNPLLVKTRDLPSGLSSSGLPLICGLRAIV